MRKTVIGLLMAGVLLVMGGLRAASLIASREEALTAAENQATTLSLILSEYLSQTFAAADAALRQLVLHSRRVGGPTAPESEWTPALTTAHAGLSGVGSISVVDRDLTIRASTISRIVGQSRNTEVVFRQALEATSDAVIVGTPFRSPIRPASYVIPLGRRLTTLDGRVVGAVVATLVPDDLQPFFRSVHVGRRGGVWVYHNAGVLIAREPSADDPIGQTAANHPVLGEVARGARAGVLRSPMEPGAPLHVASFQQVSDAPVTVAVSLDRDEVLEPWRREATVSAVSFVVVAVALAITLIVLFRQIDTNVAAERAYAAARQREAEALREARDRLAETLVREQAARQDAEAAVALKDQFVATVSHELRTPLTAIAGWSRMLVDGLVPSEQQPQALRTIERNAQAQMRLIEDLLDVAGSVTGKLRLDLRDVSVEDVVRHAADAVRPAADAKPLTLDVQIAPGLPRIEADPARLQQVVWNLISNAVKFTPAGGRITVAVTRHDEAVEIRVSDTGQGISPDLLPQVFERFRQGTTDQRPRQGGLGLGLAIVRSLVTLHGGEVVAHSDGEGKGATFVVRIPIRQAQSTHEREPSRVSA